MEHIYLSHHGIKGQKWGVRRFQLKNGRLTAAGKKRYSEDEEEQKKKAEEESAPKKKPVSEMSDQELREAINRAQLEESYRRYYEPAKQQPEIGLGEKFIQASKDVLKKQVVDPTLSSFSRSISTAVDKKISEKFGTKPKTINDLLKTDLKKLSPEELQKVVNYNDNVKKYNEQQKYNSVDSEVDRMQKERNDRRKSQIDMEQQELNLRMKRATVEKMEEERRKARDAAANIIKDVVKDVASDTVSNHMTRSQERAKAVVDQYFDEPLMLPKPDDDLKHSDVLEHHGIKGQRWGVRRYQNPDGSLTAAGKKRQERNEKREEKKEYRENVWTQQKIKQKAYDARYYADLFEKQYDKSSAKLEKRAAKDLAKNNELSKRTIRLQNTTEQLKKDRDAYQDYANKTIDLAANYTEALIKKYPDKKIKDVVRYEKDGKEYIKGSPDAMRYSLEPVRFAKDSDGNRITRYVPTKTNYYVIFY